MKYKEPKNKTCEKCSRNSPDTAEYFGKQATGQNWKQAWCLECRTEWVQNKKQR
ncbi:hypothetical protein [Peribacillus frigoritolerans]|uniref:hypothetical protein n=1 Tax=Peribacillus frigoritolerans TaxID=450367 RepID=UPI00140483EC|nr:hypothetical protein [Peribacillus frigoritolerans]